MCYLLHLTEKEQLQIIVGNNHCKGFDFTVMSSLFTLEHAPYITNVQEPANSVFYAPETWRNVFHRYTPFYPRTSVEGHVMEVNLAGVPQHCLHGIMTENFEDYELVERSDTRARYNNSYFDVTFLIPPK